MGTVHQLRPKRPEIVCTICVNGMLVASMRVAEAYQVDLRVYARPGERAVITADYAVGGVVKFVDELVTEE